MGATMDEIIKALEKMKTDMQENINQNINQLRTELQNNQKGIQTSINKLEEKSESHEKKISYMEKEGRRKNILILGLKEEENNPQELEAAILGLIQNQIKVNISITEIDYIQRIGKRNDKTSRPVLVKLLATRKAWEILNHRKNLQNSNLTLIEDFPKDVQEKRKKLVPLMKKMRQEGHHAIIKYDKLIVDGEETNEKKRNRSNDDIDLPLSKQKVESKSERKKGKPNLSFQKTISTQKPIDCFFERPRSMSVSNISTGKGPTEA